ncbi:MAG: PAS domain S-box protein [Candidatus Bathyarchaeia archaeon]
MWEKMPPQIQRTPSNIEKQYRSLIEAVPVVIYAISSDGKIKSLNQAFEKITGWKREEWLGKPFTDIIHPEDVPSALESFRKTLCGKPEPVELRVLSKSGDYLIGEFIGVPWIKDGKIVGALGIARDITERKFYEQKLQETTERLQALIQAIPDIVYFKDAQGRNLVVNSAFESLVGLSQKDIIGKTDDQLFPADLAEYCRKSDQEVLRKGVIIRAEEQTTNEKGEKKFFETIKAPIYDSQGKIVGLVGVSRDITERKLMEEVLREREELFRSVVEGSHDGIAIVDENYKIVYVNNLLTKITGYSREELIGEDFRKFLTRGSKTTVKKIDLRRLMQEQGKRELPPARYEFKIVRKDGEKRDVEVKAKTLMDAYDRVLVIAHVLDITERKRLEAERKLYEKRLSELNRYAQRLNTAKDLKEVFKLTLDAARKTLGYEYASIFLVDERNLRMVAQRGYKGPPRLVLPLDGDMGIVVRAARKGDSLNVPDVRKEKAYVKAKEGMLSELAVPIKVGSKVLGVLNVESCKLSAFKEEDVKLLEILASHAATAISNLKRQERLAAINAFGRNLIKAKNIDEICSLTLEAMQKLLGFKHVSFLLVEGDKLKLIKSLDVDYVPKLELPLNGEKGVTVRAVKTRKTVYVADTRKDPAYVKGAAEDILSELAAPIKAGNKVLGVLNVESHNLAAFDEEDVKRLEILASYVAIAISNIRKQETVAKLSKQLEHLIKSSTKIMQTKSMRRRLREIVETIQKFGWEKVTISLRDENLKLKEAVSAGFTKEEIKTMDENRVPGDVWRELLSPKFEKYKIGEFYCISRSDPTIPSEIFSKHFLAWQSSHFIYAPIRTPEGRIVAILTMDNPRADKKPSAEDLFPIELFLHQTAIILENAQLIENLERAKSALRVYADQLERKVEERTRALAEFQDKLLKAQRLAVIGELASMVGHDLRNPLTSMYAAAYYIKKRLAQEQDAKLREMIEIIERNIAYSNKIINDLLDFSRDVKLELTETSPKALIEQALSLVKVPKNIQVIVQVKGSLTMKVDVEKLKRAFINLIKNAVEAMPNGGTLTIKSRKVGDKVLFTFSDTGIGMSKEVLNKLCTPLFTTKAKGMGLGLAICKRFVEAHGGSINVRSALGEGTIFTVKIPIEPKTGDGGENYG